MVDSNADDNAPEWAEYTDADAAISSAWESLRDAKAKTDRLHRVLELCGLGHQKRSNGHVA